MDAVDEAEILKRYHAGDRPLDISAEMSIPVTEVRTVIREAGAGLPAVLKASDDAAEVIGNVNAAHAATAEDPVHARSAPRIVQEVRTPPAPPEEQPTKPVPDFEVRPEPQTPGEEPAVTVSPRRSLRRVAAREVRVDQVIADAAKSRFQRTRTLGARLGAVLADVQKALYQEAAVQTEQERVDKLVEALGEARLALLKAKEAVGIKLS